MRTIIFILLTFVSFGQEDTLGKKVIEVHGAFQIKEEVIDLCDTYIEANFIGGTSAMVNYIAQHLTYPNCLPHDFRGKVYVEFTVEINGNLTDVIVYHSPCPELEEVIVDLFEKMPPWSPASTSKRGTVKSILRIPIQICYR